MVKLCERYNSGSYHDELRLQCAIHLARFYDIIASDAYHLPQVRVDELQVCVQSFLIFRQQLARWATENGRLLYNLTPTFHVCVGTMGKQAAYINPSKCWCYNQEDFMRICVHMALSCAYGTPAANVSLSMCDKYRCLLHLRLTEFVFFM